MKHSVTLLSIVVFQAGVRSMYPMFYGFYDTGVTVYSGANELASYFFCLALIPLSSLAITASDREPTRYSKITSSIYYIALVQYVLMALDALSNMTQWHFLDLTFDILNGSSDWYITFGAVDMALLLIGVICVSQALSSYRWA